MNSKPSYEELERTIARLEDEKRRGRQFLSDILNYIPDLIFVKDEGHRWILVNNAFCSALGQSREDLIGKTDYDIHPEEEADVFWEKDDEVFASGCVNVNEEVYTDARGDRRTILTSKAAFQGVSGQNLLVGVSHDITDRKRLEQEREQLIAELQATLAKVRKLGGLLPICAHCKKIRDDKGYWNQIEAYLRTHSGAEFSHSICPECARRLYPDLDIEGLRP
jgi:PAS domain S-box-containing protein